MNNLKKIAVAAATLCSALAVQAQEINPSWYIQPSINALKPDSDFSSDKTGYGAGLRLGKPVSESWDIQIGTTYARSKDNDQRYQQNTLGVDGLYLFSRKAFRPYILVGIGAQRDKDTNLVLGDRSKTSPYASLGLGFQSTINDQWSLQTDIRNVHGFLRGDTFPSSKSNNYYFTVGLNYAFDKPPAPVRPAPPPPAPYVAPPPAPVAPPPPPPPPARFEKVTMSATELFAFDSAKLNAPQTKLDDIANVLNNNRDINNVVITGYADRIGAAKYNQKLSEQRAASVKTYLVGKGVAADRLTAVGKGSSNPVVVCSDKKKADLIKCLEPNRRVEVEQITIERRVQ
ncbi:OmpA family protein [Janthinobacterium agaricidamnosum]|uniref:OmpA family protein n=1 Tax=Janthinobacterium agaricidamnosum NBRC 102515 = DSM 9628 TaxID=1349767 RepID=W0V691_9BURK|nr:OmpA family protein [Janthinobacterium agaricidamnosum]CDG84344.1 ompA family protein [Janthinobacterium agaricidamnosum NBRC 102515 = DSM 9628]